MNKIIVPDWDTSPDSRISITVNLGRVPDGFEGAGEFCITIQAWPIAQRQDAELIARVMKDVLEAHLQIKWQEKLAS